MARGVWLPMDGGRLTVSGDAWLGPTGPIRQSGWARLQRNVCPWAAGTVPQWRCGKNPPKGAVYPLRLVPALLLLLCGRWNPDALPLVNEPAPVCHPWDHTQPCERAVGWTGFLDFS